MARKRKDYRLAFAGEHHAHGCMRCKVRYEDACETPDEDEFCTLCRTKGRMRLPWWPEDWLPKDCCVADSQRLDPKHETQRDVLERYRLVGKNTWWRCRECARTFPYDPTDDYRPAITQDAWRERNAA